MVWDTIVIADVVVQVELSVDPLALAVLEASAKNVAIVDADVLGRVVEGHADG